MTAIEKFQGLYIIDPVTGCWNWQGYRTHDGYGMYNGTYVHRVFYTTAKGEIPEGYQVDHTCKNTSCVNPDHLEAVTPLENMHRSKRTKLTDTQVREMFDLHKQGISVSHIAQRYGVRQGTVSNILNSKRRVRVWE